MSFQSLIKPAEPTFDLGPKKALLLDDCEFDRKRIQRLNSKLEHPLILEDVSDIAAMHNCLNAVSFDLIMIDYGLGKEDGFEALDMIEKHTLNKDAAKIMISGNTEASIAVSALKRGCVDYVSKRELTPDVFQKSVYDALKLARPSAVSPDLSVQEVLHQALMDGDLQKVLREAVRAAMQENAYRPNLTLTQCDDPGSLQSLLLDMTREDDFIFR